MNDDQTTPRTTSRRRRAWASAAVAAAAAIAGTSAIVATSTAAGAAPTASAAASSVHHRVSVLRFAVRFSPFHVVDVPPLAKQDGDYGIGDYAVFSDDLLNARGHVVGTEGGSGLVTRVSSTGVQVFFDMAIGLAHGQIAAQGLSSPAAHKRLAIVGGTGRYVGARGHIDLVENGNGTGSLVITLGA
jgi:hypothetical protein